MVDITPAFNLTVPVSNLSPPSPTMDCGLTGVPVIVWAIKNNKGIITPVSGASVRLTLGLFSLFSRPTIIVTDSQGIAETCILKLNYVAVDIMKSDEDFGAGTGNWFRIGSNSGLSQSHVFISEAKAAPIISPPTTLPIIPIVPPTPTAVCPKTVTTVESINHPAEILSPDQTFYVYLRGIKEVCQSDPTNPNFIKSIPKGTMGTITLGNKKVNFYLTGDGVADLDLVRDLGFDLKSILGV